MFPSRLRMKSWRLAARKNHAHPFGLYGNSFRQNMDAQSTDRMVLFSRGTRAIATSQHNPNSISDAGSGCKDFFQRCSGAAQNLPRPWARLCFVPGARLVGTSGIFAFRLENHCHGYALSTQDQQTQARARDRLSCSDEDQIRSEDHQQQASAGTGTTQRCCSIRPNESVCNTSPVQTQPTDRMIAR